MTRSNARELVLHLILDMDYTHDAPAEIVEARLEKEYYATLKEEHEAYAERPNQKQVDYIQKTVAGIREKEEELRAYISKYAIGWNINRISRLARAVLELAIYEILYGEDVPVSVAISEAMTLIKKYESEETASFVNGILGTFVREEGRE